jgi:hypothetical protein
MSKKTGRQANDRLSAKQPSRQFMRKIRLPSPVWMFSIFWCIPLFIWYTVNPRTSRVSLQLDGQIKSTNWSSWDIPNANKLDIGELCGVHLRNSINSLLQSSSFKENCGESILEHLKFEKCDELQCEIVENFNIGKLTTCGKVTNWLIRLKLLTEAKQKVRSEASRRNISENNF